jgi:putative zinc finger/helix-turn-helix YgiT family protein
MYDPNSAVDMNEVRPCPDCGAVAARASFRPHTFLYGAHYPAELTTTIPIWTCEVCGFAYTDGRGEELEHEAICRHLKVLAPREIQELRERHALSRAELGRLTRFGEASIKRWERGAVIQNASADRFLRSLDDPAVLERLKRLDAELSGAPQDALTLADADPAATTAVEPQVGQSAADHAEPGDQDVGRRAPERGSNLVAGVPFGKGSRRTGQRTAIRRSGPVPANSGAGSVYFPIAASTTEGLHRPTEKLSHVGPIWVNGRKSDLLLDTASRTFLLSQLPDDASRVFLLGEPYCLKSSAFNGLLEVVGLKHGDVADVIDAHGTTETCAHLEVGPSDSPT